MPPRHLINNRESFVDDSLAGFAAFNARYVRLNASPRFFTRVAGKAPDKVVIVAGGGSGHEPLHVGFVGAGMLDAAVPGEIFASPTAQQIHAASRAVGGTAGVLHIVKNYTGDVMNFAVARDLLAEEDIECESVLVDDDLSTDGEGGGPGRRGTAAALIVEKVCGAAADAGASLAEVVEIGREVAAHARTLAIALSPCTHPGDTSASFDLPEGMVELGIGIHGERGVDRIPAATARELVAGELVPRMIGATNLQEGDACIAVVNGLGATTALELGLVANELYIALQERGITIARGLCGTYVTALDMAGCSITLASANPQTIGLWDAPVRTSALTW